MALERLPLSPLWKLGGSLGSCSPPLPMLSSEAMAGTFVSAVAGEGTSGEGW